VAPGRYQVRLFANNGFTKLATSNTITVPTPPAITINDVSATEGHVGSKNFVFTVSRDFVRRASVMKAARSYDAILIYREASLIGPAIYERLLARTGKPIILDFDDAIWSPAQAHLNGLFSRLHGACCHCNSITRPRKPGSLCPIKSPKPSSWRKRTARDRRASPARSPTLGR